MKEGNDTVYLSAKVDLHDITVLQHRVIPTIRGVVSSDMVQ